MRLRRFDPATYLNGFGIVLPEGGGPFALPVAAGPLARRLDRYGRLGVAAAAAALEAAAATPPGALDPAWGVMIGSSLGCLESNRDHDRAVRDRPLEEMSPALFVRTVSSVVTGDISIAWRLGGPSETFVSGWTAGVDALIAAAAALEAGRARRVLAGAVEAPGAAFHVGGAAAPREAAAMALLAGTPKPGTLRLIAAGRGFDRRGTLSLREVMDGLAPARIASVVVANGVPPGLLARWRGEAGQVPVVDQSKRTGELASVGLFAALRDAAAGSGVTLVIVRGPEGETAVVAAACSST